MKTRIRWILPLAILLMLLSAASLAEQKHSVLLRCSGGGYAGRTQTKSSAVILEPALSFSDSGGGRWTLRDLVSAPGFNLELATLRMTVTGVEGASLTYALSCGSDYSSPRSVEEGRVIWDVTAPVSRWIQDGLPEGGLRLTGLFNEKGKGIQVEDGSCTLLLRFTAGGELPLFPLDRVEEEPWLDHALSMLEETSPFLVHYKSVSDSLVQAPWPLGVPYYYGGSDEEKILMRFNPDQITRYYHSDRQYFCGLDCAGFINLVLRKCELEPIKICRMLRDGQGSALMDDVDPSRWPDFLLPGDLIGMRHGRYHHVLMYIGTLRTFGWDEKTAGESLPVLDMPLVIHCGDNPFYYGRYLAYIREQGYTGTYPPDGGVTVSVVLASGLQAPYRVDPPWGWGDTFCSYQIDNSPLLVFSLDKCRDLVWYGFR